jgi:hypothetical protein
VIGPRRLSEDERLALPFERRRIAGTPQDVEVDPGF